jgi:hypothetical protein
MKAFSHIVSGLSAHWRSALSVALPWLFLSTLLNVWSFKVHPPSVDPMADFSLSWTDWVVVALSLVASSSVAVSWHQFILQDKPLSGARAFRMDRKVWLYLLRMLLIIVLCTVPLVALIIASTLLPPLFLPVILGLFIQLLIFAHRMMISLPAVGVGDHQSSIRHCVELTRGNNLRLLGLVALVYLLVMVLFLLFLSFVGAITSASPNLGLIASFILGIPVLFLHMMLTTNLLTSLYGFFVQGRDF